MCVLVFQEECMLSSLVRVSTLGMILWQNKLRRNLSSLKENEAPAGSSRKNLEIKFDNGKVLNIEFKGIARFVNGE